MHAILLAAGVGRRLLQDRPRPKCLLEFAGRSLLARHYANLAAVGVSRVSLVLGFAAAEVEHALGDCPSLPTLVRYNPLYTLGSCVSLWMARQSLTCGDDVLLLDADVLYHPDILRRLVASPHPNCCLLDRDFVAGDEPVKICLNDGRIVEFHKQLATTLRYTTIGESVGFFKFDATTALRLALLLDGYVADGRRAQPHEEALRELALMPDAPVGVEDVTGLPWIEIDFPADVERAANSLVALVDA